MPGDLVFPCAEHTLSPRCPLTSTQGSLCAHHGATSCERFSCSMGKSTGDAGAWAPRYVHFPGEKTCAERLSGLATSLTRTSSSWPLSPPSCHPHTASGGHLRPGIPAQLPSEDTLSFPLWHQDAMYAASNDG